MSMDAEFRLFLRRYDEDRCKADEDRRKSDEERRKADLRFETLLRRLDRHDAVIEKLIQKSDRRERELAQGLAKIGKRIIDTQIAILDTQKAILDTLRIQGNGRPNDGNGPRRN